MKGGSDGDVGLHALKHFKMAVAHINLGEFPEKRRPLLARNQKRDQGIPQIDNAVIFYFAKLRNKLQFVPQGSFFIINHDLMNIGASLQNASRTRSHHRRDPSFRIFPAKRHDYRGRHDHIPEIA
jgi:hypothetical protein